MLTAGILCLPASLHAQSPLQVRAVTGLCFGSILRTGASLVQYYSSNAAMFEVTGEPGADILLKIEASELTQPNGPAERRPLDLTIVPELCAYSTDNGMSWTPFNSRLLWQQVHFPSGGRGPSTIIVRVGGRVSAHADQHRGNYAGSITLTAVHK